MDREIKFRALVDGVMVYPQDLFGDVRGEVLISLSGEPYLFAESSNGNYCPSTIDAKRKAKTILMQFTGLLDKNGKEVYEGDILSVRPIGANYPVKNVVVFNDKQAFQMRFVDRFVSKEGSFYDEDLDFNGKDIFEVIGNIYENPELLQEVEKGMKENKNA